MKMSTCAHLLSMAPVLLLSMLRMHFHLRLHLAPTFRLARFERRLVPRRGVPYRPRVLLPQPAHLGSMRLVLLSQVGAT